MAAAGTGHRRFPRREGPGPDEPGYRRAQLLGSRPAGYRESPHLTTGGSLGGMITLALAALAPERFERILPLATSVAASALGRRLEPRGPPDPAARSRRSRTTCRSRPRDRPPARRFSTYRASPGLDASRARRGAVVADRLSRAELPRAPRGTKLRRTAFAAQAVRAAARRDGPPRPARSRCPATQQPAISRVRACDAGGRRGHRPAFHPGAGRGARRRISARPAPSVERDHGGERPRP